MVKKKTSAVEDFFLHISQTAILPPRVTQYLPRIVNLEDELSSNDDIDHVLHHHPETFRELMDIQSAIKLHLSLEEAEYKQKYDKAIVLAKQSRIGQKLTVADVQALVFEDDPSLSSLHAKIEVLRVLVEHLKEARNLALMRKDIVIERSIDRRSLRKDEASAI